MLRPLPFFSFLALLSSLTPLIALSEESKAPVPISKEIERDIEMREESAVHESTEDESFYTLDRCLDLALEQNFQIRSAKTDIEEATGVKLELRSSSLPRVTSETEYQRIDQGRIPSLQGQTFGTDTAWTARFTLSQDLALGGEQLAQWRQGGLLEDAAINALEATTNQVTFDVRRRFYDVLLAKAQVGVQRQSVELLKRELELEQNRFDVGTVASFNVLRAEVEVANAKTPLIRARNDLRLSFEELSRVLGLPHSDPEAIDFSFKIQGKLEFAEPELNLPKAIRAAFEQRPELKQLRLVREAEKRGIDVQSSSFFPTITGFGGFDWERSRFTDTFSKIDSGWFVGARAQWNLFEGGSRYGRLRQARARYNRAQVDLDELEKNVEIEVRTALSELLEARQLVLASRKVVERAEESLRQARARLEAGTGLQIDVLDTQVALTQARTNEVEALHSFNISRAELDRATGERREAP